MAPTAQSKAGENPVQLVKFRYSHKPLEDFLGLGMVSPNTKNSMASSQTAPWMHTNKDIEVNHCPGDTKLSKKWQSTGDSTKEHYFWPFAQIINYSGKTWNTRYSYLITQRELVVLRISRAVIGSGIAQTRSSRTPVQTPTGEHEGTYSPLFVPPSSPVAGQSTTPERQSHQSNVSIGSSVSPSARHSAKSLESSVLQSPGPYEPTVILIDLTILRDEFLLESSQLYQDIQDGDTIWSSQQEMPCPYPETPIVPQSIFDNDRLPIGLIDEDRPGTHRHGGERDREIYLGSHAQSNGSSLQGPQQHHRSNDVNWAG
uniref:Uncharacterized protein n=1 Tax=Coccidioides posadasii RMSCC 3488 TaxID=454284 RepID=A0A0J6FU91_COCPO|nr:hypothetical protein CPAG_09250 [Coccidioides posadasii RMSCC 3488]